MARVEVSRLAMACPAQHSAAPRIRLEDALQCEIPDDDRLVLIRRMAISAGGSAPRAGYRQQAMRSAWQLATEGARHGSESGAPTANCVWFASEAEAEIVLLDLLLRGCAPVGWFWRLAVPKWLARPVSDWLADLVAEAVVPGREAKLARLIACCADCGAINALAAALQAAVGFNATSSFSAQDLTILETPSSNHDQTDLASTVAIEALRQFPASVLTAFRAVQASPEGASAIRAVLRAQVLRFSPALAMRPMLLAEIVARTEGKLQSPNAAAGTPKSVIKARTDRSARTDASPIKQWSKAEANPEAALVQDQVQVGAPTQPEMAIEAAHQPRADEQERRIAPSLLTGRALQSGYAGVWLAIPALSDLGLRTWLQDRPELLGDHPGAQLITAIARHHGCAADDPALSGLPRLDPQQPAPPWTGLWRRALDRWLRRTARRRLHDLARRPGKLLWSDDRLQITFPLAAADIRLRRLALDRDPGWTDWLGLSVRFAYSDEVRL